jgi:hypothetical protein
MPRNDRLRFDDNEDITRSAENPSYPVLDPQLRARMFSLENTKLLTEGEDLKTEVVTGTKVGAQEAEK